MHNHFFAEKKRPWILGHRGAKAFAPENTMAAFHLAAEQGADGFEFDIQLSKDGVPVIIHDDTLDRTTSGKGPVNRFTVDELQEFDAGDGERIPTLEHFLKTFGTRFLYNVEIKAYSLQSNGVETAVADLIEKYDVADRCIVSSFSFLNMHRYRRLRHADTALAIIRVPSPQALSKYLFHGEADHPHYRLVDESYMEWANNAGFRVNVWTVNDVAEAARLTRFNVDSLITDKPGEILAVASTGG